MEARQSWQVPRYIIKHYWVREWDVDGRRIMERQRQRGSGRWVPVQAGGSRAFAFSRRKHLHLPLPTHKEGGCPPVPVAASLSWPVLPDTWRAGLLIRDVI